MNIYVAATLFAVLILIYWVISELFTVLFRFVGLPEEKARFQVTSLLTGCGFTTRESEMILTSKPRRRLARMLMLFGYVFNISVVSAFISVFLSLKTEQFGGYIGSILIPLGAVSVVFIITRIKPVRGFINSKIEKFAGNIVKSRTVNTVTLIDHIGKGTIAQITLNEVPSFLSDTPLCETGIKENMNILVMLVEHSDMTIEAPSAKTIFVKGDKLTVFGDYKSICRNFNARERFV